MFVSVVVNACRGRSLLPFKSGKRVPDIISSQNSKDNIVMFGPNWDEVKILAQWKTLEKSFGLAYTRSIYSLRKNWKRKEHTQFEPFRIFAFELLRKSSWQNPKPWRLTHAIPVKFFVHHKTTTRLHPR